MKGTFHVEMGIFTCVKEKHTLADLLLAGLNCEKSLLTCSVLFSSSFLTQRRLEQSTRKVGMCFGLVMTEPIEFSPYIFILN